MMMHTSCGGKNTSRFLEKCFIYDTFEIMIPMNLLLDNAESSRVAFVTENYLKFQEEHYRINYSLVN